MVPCRCKSHKCAGVPRNRKTRDRHAREDAELFSIETISMPGENIAYSCPFYPALYAYHETALTPLYENAEITKLDHIFIEFRKFVAHPISHERSRLRQFQKRQVSEASKT